MTTLLKDTIQVFEKRLRILEKTVKNLAQDQLSETVKEQAQSMRTASCAFQEDQVVFMSQCEKAENSAARAMKAAEKLDKFDESMSKHFNQK